MKTKTLWVGAALLLAAPSVVAGQTGTPGDPPRRAPDRGDVAAFDLRVPLEAISSAWRDAQEQLLQAQRGQARPQPDEQRDSQWEAQYERARQAIERAQWAQAVQQFTILAQAKAPRADAAT